MSVKVRKVFEKTVKTIDKNKVNIEKTKDYIVNVKNKSEKAYNNEDESAADYSIDRLSSYNMSIPSNIKNRVKSIEPKLTEKKKIRKTSKNIKAFYNKVKKEKEVAKETIKASRNARKLAKEATKRTYQSIKLSIKLTFNTVKAIIIGTKMVISALFAIGWVAILIIVGVCLIGTLFSSIYGIFFSSEDTGNGISMNNVVKEINADMTYRIKEIQNSNVYDDYRIVSNRARWQDILIIYVAKISNEKEVMTLDDNKIDILKSIFWDMNIITTEIKEEVIEEIIGNNETQITKKRILYINISSKSIEDMMNKYNFNEEQRNQVEELSKEEFNGLWFAPIYGSKPGNSSIVEIALQEVGNIGGEKYWKWYGFNSRVEWCAIFVSWVANEANYINNGIIPKFAGVQNGIDWFKVLDQWEDSSYIPNSGDLIFFDWENDGKPNHVGIVEKVDNGEVYTIEGNSNDECKHKSYKLNSKVIFGYGVVK